MVTEPQRSQYLEAMGLTAWVSRYRLPNAAETLACEWLEPEAPVEQAPSQRLHALLDTPVEAPPHSPAETTPVSPQRQRKRARGLLESEGVMEADEDAPTASPARETAPVEAGERRTQASLRFALQVAALDGRWLVMVPRRQPLDGTSRRLLDNLLQAAGILPRNAPVFQEFYWPLVEGAPVESPLDEACDGLRAFVDGQRRRGWRPERVLVFGEDDTLAPVLALTDGRCGLLDIDGWQGPSLEVLTKSPDAKRELWRAMVDWHEAWHGAADGEPDDAS
ncbi:hypothetical protein DFO67_11292 [Modicisalibacter xianhensis]|uniref:Uncharacterized protein n=1 Tax=Modicisalibacter xianhensis TaxID=442341 RepID=A0A4R8FWE5_9GAMM|nr:hypothetical protein [Halomonas xianhensis]TDX27877.1 hypothetical protein DFO67_11292 [Halomonas xianhensis]